VQHFEERWAAADGLGLFAQGLYHEIHNEPDQRQVLAYLSAWLDGVCTR
jgi:alpha-beta hydrolase superfamily lysophospholipase